MVSAEPADWPASFGKPGKPSCRATARAGFRQLSDTPEPAKAAQSCLTPGFTVGAALRPAQVYASFLGFQCSRQIDHKHEEREHLTTVWFLA